MTATLALFVAACVEDAAPPPPRGDELVLELGGSAPSLRAALRRKAPAPADRSPGIHTPAAPPPASAPATVASPPAADPHPAPNPDAAQPGTSTNPPPSAPPKAERDPEGPEETIKQADPSRSPPPRRRDANGGKPVPASAERETAKSAKEKPPEGGGKTVKLRRGQNLYRVALEQLGDGKRWREIAALNGWSERDIANLAPDTPIRLPAR